MRQRTLISGAAAGAAIIIATAAATAPRAWRRLRRRSDAPDVVDTPFSEPLGDPEAAFDPEANAALREELRDRVHDLQEVVDPPSAPADAALPAPASDPETEAARARLREKAAAARQSFTR